MNAASGSGSGFPCAKREIAQAATADLPRADVADAIEGVSVNEPRPPNLGCDRDRWQSAPAARRGHHLTTQLRCSAFAVALSD